MNRSNENSESPDSLQKGLRYSLPFFTRLSTKDQTLFAKRLSFLVKAGVPLLESLQIIRSQTGSKGVQKLYRYVMHDVANGRYLHHSLGRFSNIFGDFAINIIRVGEMGGTLSENLEHLSEELKKRDKLRKKIIGALVYPIFITIATLGVTGLLTVYIFPKIMPIFQSLNVALPFTTRSLIWVSDFLRSYGLLTVLGAVGIWAVFLLLYKRIARFRLSVDKAIIRTPFVGRFVRGYNSANMCRTLGLLLLGNVPVVESVQITSDTTKNALYKQRLDGLANAITRGEAINVYLRRYPRAFPEILVNTVMVGERTGKLADTLLYLAEMYDDEVDDLAKNLSNSIEPALMIFMGLLVGFVAVSVITPIYDITQNLQR